MSIKKNKPENRKIAFNKNIGLGIITLEDTLKELKHYCINHDTKKPEYAPFDEKAYRSMVDKSLEEIATRGNDGLEMINSEIRSPEDAKLFISYFIADRHIAKLSNIIEDFRQSNEHRFFYATMQMALTGMKNNLEYNEHKEDVDAKIKKLWGYIFIIEDGMQCSDLVTGLSYLSIAFKDLDMGVSVNVEKHLEAILEDMEWLTTPIEILNLERKDEEPKSKKKSSESQNNDMYS